MPSDTVDLSWPEAVALARRLHERIVERFEPHERVAYPIPRGGLFVAAMLAALSDVQITSDPHAAQFAVDDIIDSGATAERMQQDHGLETLALIDQRDKQPQPWVVFPWDVDGLERDLRDTIIRLCQQTGVELPLP